MYLLVNMIFEKEGNEMKITYEIEIRNFNFWCGGADRAKFIENNFPEKWEEIEQTLNELYPDGIDETSLNDIFWFDDEFFAEMGCDYDD